MSRRIPILLWAASAAMSQPQLTPEVRTRQLLDRLLARDYEAVYARFDDGMRKAISLEQFKEQSAQLASMGKPESIGEPRSTNIRTMAVVTVPVSWKAMTLEFVLTWGNDGRIAGAFFRLPESPAAPRPEYGKPDSFTQTEVTVGEDPWKLPGTLALPKGKGPFAAVVLVHGSGAHDRDETIGPNKPFRDLAEGLASRGIAVLRYEKRNRVHTAACAADPNFTMNQETVEDAVRAAALLRKTPGINAGRVFVLGHSQGGYMLPRILMRDPGIAGGIMMAGNVRPLEELVLEQAEYIASLQPSITPEQKRQIDELRRDPARALRLPGPYMADLKGYNPAALARRIDRPFLILQGERDYQVTMKDFDLWKAALEERQNVTFRPYAKLNHLMQTGNGRSTPGEYQKPGHVAVEVIEDIASWVNSR